MSPSTQVYTCAADPSLGQFCFWNSLILTWGVYVLSPRQYGIVGSWCRILRFTTEVTSSRGGSEENCDLGLVLHSPVLQWMHLPSIDVLLRSYPRQPLSLSTLKESKRPLYRVLTTQSLLQLRFFNGTGSFPRRPFLSTSLYRYCRDTVTYLITACLCLIVYSELLPHLVGSCSCKRERAY